MKDRLMVSLLSFIAGTLAILLSRSLFAPTPAHAQLEQTPSQIGRYTAVAVPGSGGSGSSPLPTLYVVDTQTGHAWSYNQNWTDLGTPTTATQTPMPSPAQKPSPAPIEKAKGALTVIVKQADTADAADRGKPVADAIIRIDGENIPRSLNVRTDAFGIATFQGVPEGTYSVYFSSTMYELFPKPKDRESPIAEVMIRNKETATLSLTATKLRVFLGIRLQTRP
jgi:hypothetical protein